MYDSDESIRLIRDFISGKDVGYEIDDFLSTKCSDPVSENLRLFVLKTAEDFPAIDHGFTSAIGLENIREFVEKIR